MDVSAGDWLTARIDDPWRGTMHDVVPRGFAAYARVFHPASVQEIPGERMPSLEQWRESAPSELQDLQQRIVHRRVTWGETAQAFGTVFHPGAQWGPLTGSGADGGGQVDSSDGRWFDDPSVGALEPDLFTALAKSLAAHTTTPDAGFAALWEGSGGLVGRLGTGPSRSFFQAGDPGDADLQRHNEMLGRSVKDVWNNVFRKATWQDGILSREISEGPRLRLPERAFVMFRGGAQEFAVDDWELQMPWRDLPAEAHGFEPSATSPSLLWPDDHAWAVVSEVDFDSTIVAGSAELIAAIVGDPRLEAAEIPVDAVLGYGVDDEVNR